MPPNAVAGVPGASAGVLTKRTRLMAVGRLPTSLTWSDTVFAHPVGPTAWLVVPCLVPATSQGSTRDPSETADDSLDLRCHPPSAPGAFSPLSMWSSTRD